MRIYEKAFGADHINTADTINNLGSIYSRQGKYDEAIAQHERALRIKEKAFGADHINTASTINNLGLTYDSQGKYNEAIAQYERALRIKEKAFGADHINTAGTINNLGVTYNSQGKYDEAIAQYERALRIYKKTFGADHINTADTINNLGLTYDSQGKYDEAIAQYKRALRIKEKAFGADHINTADTINNLGSTYDSQGKYDEAIAQYERALRIYEKAFGADHINTAGTINNLGVTYDSQGKYDEAIAQYERALNIFESKPLKDPRTGQVHENIAMTFLNRFRISMSADNRQAAFWHLQRSALTTIEQDPRLTFRFEKLRTILIFLTNTEEATIEEACEQSLKVSTYLFRLKVLTFIQCSAFFKKLASDCFVQRRYLNAILAYENSLELDPQNHGVNNFEDIVHGSVKCDGCSEEPIKGIRFKCRVCEDYDLCTRCFQRRSELHPQHQMFLEIPRNRSTHRESEVEEVPDLTERREVVRNKVICGYIV